MTIKQALKLASGKLRKVSDNPWIDTEVLLCYVLKRNKSWLYTYPNKKLTPGQYQSFQKIIKRRLKHEPIAYITQHKEFYGLDFYVNRRVMIPRPETELLIDEVISLVTALGNLVTVADIGTGSGCIAIALAKEIRAKIYATDISNAILNIAKKNAKKHKVLNKITFLKGDLLHPLKNRKIDVIVANLPYLTTKQWLSTKPDIRKYESREALDGGKDGLNYIRELLYQALKRKDIKAIILEMGGKRQANKIKKIAKTLWPKCKIKIKKDLRGLDRVVIISLA